MKAGDIVRVEVLGRNYLARVTEVNRKVKVRFLSQVPEIGGSRRRARSFLKTDLRPHDKSGISWKIFIGMR